ncbi:hypothetical protein NHX12_005002, partial [Muraenolepis orangiensis]
GAISKETKKRYYVRSYKLDQTLARYVRVRPMSWEQGICMRFEIYGCKTSDYPCSGMLGMVSGQISDAQIVASSHADRGWVPENSRLLTGRSGWTQQQTKQPFRNEWLQVDLGQDKMVSGVLIQGGKHRDRNVFMKRFKVGYSQDAEQWTLVREENGTKPRVFAGNQNHDTPELRGLGAPLQARYVRLYPEKATPEGLGLRLELLGCDLDEPTTLPPSTVALVTMASGGASTFGATTGGPVTSPGREDGEEGPTLPPAGCVTEATEPVNTPGYLWFACDFDFSSLCGWSREGGLGAEWAYKSAHGAPNTGRDTPGLTCLPIAVPHGELCLSFWYQMPGEFTGSLHIKQRGPGGGAQLLWTVSGPLGWCWREGRVILPHAPSAYQVLVEGVADRRRTAHIAIGHFQILGTLEQVQCKDPETPTTPPTEVFKLRE